MDKDSGYWQVMTEEEARERLALFTPDGKRWWKVISMWDLYAATTFVAMAMNLKMEGDTLAKERRFKSPTSIIIVDDVLLYGCTAEQLLNYFITVLDLLKHQHTTLKLKKCKCFQDRCNFLGMDVAAGGTEPTQSKNEAFFKLEQPNTRGDLHMLIGIFRFYSQFLPLY